MGQIILSRGGTTPTQKGRGGKFPPRFWGDSERSERQRGEAPMGSEICLIKTVERRAGGPIPSLGIMSRRLTERKRRKP